MYAMTVETWTDVIGRGKVAVIAKGGLPEGIWDPVQLRGETVLLDNVQYKIHGIERWLIMCTPQNPYYLSFGLIGNKVE